MMIWYMNVEFPSIVPSTNRRNSEDEGTHPYQLENAKYREKFVCSR